MTTATLTSPPPRSHLSLAWLDSYGDDLYAYAIRRVRRPETAEDLVQETLLAAVEGCETFANQSSVRTWLIGILRHKIADHFRDRYRHEPDNAGQMEEDALFDRRGRWKVAVQKWGGDPQCLAELTELRSVLDACVSKLPPRMAYLIATRATQEATTSDLCDELAISQDNAWMLLHRARLRLRHCLTTNWFTEKLGKGTRVA
ncbi:MAG: sigma-70 family polymerase sigma factor [Phycisphaerales bacterium]|nr:sigma-70 family polymerase sigma factor [Phycisphaerales bacterium]